MHAAAMKGYWSLLHVASHRDPFPAWQVVGLEGDAGQFLLAERVQLDDRLHGFVLKDRYPHIFGRSVTTGQGEARISLGPLSRP